MKLTINGMDATVDGDAITIGRCSFQISLNRGCGWADRHCCSVEYDVERSYDAAGEGGYYETSIEDFNKAFCKFIALAEEDQE